MTRGQMALLVAVVMAAGVTAAACGEPVEPESDLQPSPRPAVLHVTHISLFPRINRPDTTQKDPDAGFPEVGQEVQWVGHIVNSGEVPVDGVAYRWSVDGEVVAEGETALEGGEEVTVMLPRPWPASRELIKLTIVDSAFQARGDPVLEVRSDALSLGLWAYPELVERMERDTLIDPWVVWAGRAARAWNEDLGLYPMYRPSDGPEEILDRFRLDRVEVLPDDWDWFEDLTTDLWWRFLPERTSSRYISATGPRDRFEDQTIVLHEMLHERGITDLYAYRVLQGGNGSEVRIREPDGSLAVGGPRMPYVVTFSRGGGVVFDSPYQNRLMGRDRRRPARIDPHTVYGLNQLAGLRPRTYTDQWNNYFNQFSPGRPGGNPYLTHVPDSARLEIHVDDEPAPAGARVEVFFDYGFSYRVLYREEPDLHLETDANGVVTFAVDVLAAPPTPDLPSTSEVVILRVTVGDEWGYAYLPVYELNMEYIRGKRTYADVVVEATVE